MVANASAKTSEDKKDLGYFLLFHDRSRVRENSDLRHGSCDRHQAPFRWLASVLKLVRTPQTLHSCSHLLAGSPPPYTGFRTRAAYLPVSHDLDTSIIALKRASPIRTLPLPREVSRLSTCTGHSSLAGAVTIELSESGVLDDSLTRIDSA